eukprot:TRINITY_DN890_c0_g1_i2.p1 TRINITY_DN890_c0_g1~~TRINITY_DN890_c0_g1_i2.p1  ORF type:complete len:295 (+),score=101.15 TRINITY_DN890_c0_g1_i2:95-979(+)
MSGLLAAIGTTRPNGEIDLVSALKVAQLVLKHRQNKLQKPRVVLFVGSPVTVDAEKLKKIGTELKKNNIAVDVINFGEHEVNTTLLEGLVAAVNKSDNSHLITVPPGPHILSDMLEKSAVIASSGGGEGGAMNPDAFADADPELAMALRMSLEEERQRQERIRLAATGEQPASAGAEGSAPAQDSQRVGMLAAHDGEMDEEAQLQLALQMSMADEQARRDAEMTDAEPVTPQQPTSGAAGQPSATDVSAALQDTEFLGDILSSLPGVDTSDASVQQLLQQMKKPDDKKPDEDKK